MASIPEIPVAKPADTPKPLNVDWSQYAAPAQTDLDVDWSKYAQTPVTDLTPDEDMAVRTVIGEAKHEGDLGWRSVAGVIRNRSTLSGKRFRDVVLEKNQFEPWSSRRQELEGYDPNSSAYRSVAASIIPVLRGEADDPTGGATHFYSPSSQRALGRSAPAWDRGNGTDIGNHRFFKLPYGGSKANPDLNVDWSQYSDAPEAALTPDTTPNDGEKQFQQPGEPLAVDTAPAPQPQQTDDADKRYQDWLKTQKKVASADTRAEFDKQTKEIDDKYQAWAKTQSLDPTSNDTVSAFNKAQQDEATQKVLTENPDYAEYLKAGSLTDSDENRKTYQTLMQGTVDVANKANAGIAATANAQTKAQTAKAKAFNAKVAARKAAADAQTPEIMVVTDPAALRQLGNGPAPPPTIQVDLKNHPEQALNGAGGTGEADIKQKPAGMNTGRYLLDTALHQIAPEWGFTPADIQAQLDAMQNRGQKFSQVMNDMTDADWQQQYQLGHTGRVQFTVTNATINEMLARKKGKQLGLQGLDTETNQIEPELLDRIGYQNALNAPYNPPDVSLRNPYLRQTGDALLDQASRNVMLDPFSKGTDAEIQAEYERLKKMTPSAEERQNDESLGDYLKSFISSTATQAGASPDAANFAASAVSGVIGGAERLGEFGTGLNKEFGALSPLNWMDSIATWLGVPSQTPEDRIRMLDNARIIAKSAKGDGFIADVGELAGSLPLDAARLVAVTMMSGGNPAIAFGVDEYLRSGGRGEGWEQKLKAGAQGAVMGLAFAGIGKVAKWAGTVAARKLLTPELVDGLNSAESDVAFEQSIFKKAYKYDQRSEFPDASDSPASTEHMAKMRDKVLRDNGLTPESYENYKSQVHTHLREQPGFSGDVARAPLEGELPAYKSSAATERSALFEAAKRKAVMVKTLVERGTAMGLVATAGFVSAKIEGKSNAEATKNAGLFLIMEAAMSGMHKAEGEPWTAEDIEAANGRVIRVPGDEEPPASGGGGKPPADGSGGGGKALGEATKQIAPTKDVLLVADPDGRRLHAFDVTDLVTPDAVDAQILPVPKPAVSVDDFTPNLPAAPAGTFEPPVEQQSDFASKTPAEQEAIIREEGRTVSHPNPDIDGKPIVGTTADGKVIVPNEANKGGVSVVTDHTEAEPAQEEAPVAGSLLIDTPKPQPEDDFMKSIIGEKGAANLEPQRIAGLDAAKELEQKDWHPSAIWRETGWMKGKDGKWRAEIPDVKVKTNLLDALHDDHGNDTSFSLGGVVDGDTAKSLFKAYPDLKNMRVEVDKGGDFVAYHRASTNSIHLGDDAGWTGQTIDQIIGHEIQHAIQHREGFAEGASTKFFRAKAQQKALAEYNKIRAKYPDWTDGSRSFDVNNPEELKDGKRLQKLLKTIQNPSAATLAAEHEKYNRTAGEVEARNVENRMHMGERQRQDTPLTNTEDRARRSQIILKGNDVVAGSEKSPEVTKLTEADKLRHRQAFEVPVIEDAAMLKKRVKIVYHTPTGKSVVRTMTAGDRQKELKRQITVMGKLLDCIGNG